MVFLPRKKANQWENIFSGHDFGHYLPLYLSLWIHVCVTINHYKNKPSLERLARKVKRCDYDESWKKLVVPRNSHYCICGYICTHIHIRYICIYIHIHIHTYIIIYIYTHELYHNISHKMMVCLCVSSPTHPVQQRKTQKCWKMGRGFTCQMGFWMCWCPYCWSSTLLIPRRNSEKSKILDVLGIARTGRSRKTDVSQKLMDFQKILESNIFHWRSIFFWSYIEGTKPKKKSWWLLELIRWFGSVDVQQHF